ncbi:alpha-humulene 10-hydroxylase-like [Pistacia vera]|uniref:alpha-humulene 10-hydroxylase-like n=1 Tax=Pistacia vera TaxID=55513 RepID=UPI00126382A7|nr:alpha-humulene 10-hydroxylase-like [Pistacia vera]
MDTTIKLLKYLKGCPGLGLLLPRDGNLDVTAYCDSDWEHKLKRKANTNDNDDIVDTLINYEEVDKNEFRFTIHQVKAVTMGVRLQASAALTEWSMSELLKYPSNGESTSRGPLLPREARESCEISGYKIPAEAKILINTYAMGRDPEIWKDPESFQPERFEGSSIDFRGNHFELIPFGAARRICPGISFATSTIELGLAQMLLSLRLETPKWDQTRRLGYD